MGDWATLVIAEHKITKVINKAAKDLCTSALLPSRIPQTLAEEWHASNALIFHKT